MVSGLLSAIGLFLATNIDDIIVLSLFFARGAGQRGTTARITAGQYLGFAGILGAAVLVPNVRGSSGYGKTFLNLDNAEKREDSVKDIGALLDWIGQQPNLDANRVAVYGQSYGGYMSLAVMTHYSDRLVGGDRIRRLCACRRA